MKKCLECRSKLVIVKGERLYSKEIGYNNFYLDGIVQ